MPTKQETFDTVINHLRKQKSRAQFVHKGHITGAYKEVDGNRGPIGLLLGDLVFDDMEGKTVLDNNMRFIMRHRGYDISLCNELQTIHDLIEPEDWEYSFQGVGVKYNLEYHCPPDIAELLNPPEPFDAIVGYLIQGRFVWWSNTNETDLKLQYPRPIKIYKSQVGNYSQICSRTKMLVIDGLKNEFGKAMCLFAH